MRKWIFFAFIAFVSLAGCSKKTELRREFSPLINDGINRVTFSDHSNEWRFSGNWSPPRIGQDKRFYREVKHEEAHLEFFAAQSEKYILQVKARSSSGNAFVRIGNKNISLDSSRILISKEFIQPGENSLSFFSTGKLRVYNLLLYPKRILRFINYENMLKDNHTLLMPGEFCYFIKPYKNESLNLKLNLHKRKNILLKVEITTAKENTDYTQKIKDGSVFKVKLKENQFQKVIVKPVDANAGYLRIGESFLALERNTNRENTKRYKKIKQLVANKNILIVLLDATRNDHVSYNGYKRNTTPNIDKLAQNSMVFDRAHSEASYTLASTGTLLTGLPPDYHGVISKYYSSLNKKIPTIAKLFSAKGYFTGAISGNPNFGKAYGYHRGFSEFRELFLNNPAPLAEEFINPFSEMLEQANGKPFFIYLHIREPHDPFIMPKPFLGRFQSAFVEHSEELKKFGDTFHISYVDEDDNPDLLKKIYDENLAYGDWVAGQILALVKQKNLSEQTITVFISDHGEAIGEHGMIGHGHVLYQQGIRIPLMIQIPGVVAGHVDTPAITSDLIKTFTDLFDLPYAYSDFSYGENLFNLQSERRHVARSINVAQYPHYMVKQFPYKMILRLPIANENIKVFNLDNDPGENMNIADRKLVKETLMFYLFNHLKNAKKAQHQIFESTLRKSDLEALRALGYIE